MRKLLLILLLLPSFVLAADSEVHDPTVDITTEWHPSTASQHWQILSDDFNATFDSVTDNAMNGYRVMLQFDNTAISDSTIDSVVFSATYRETNGSNTFAILDSIPGVAARQSADLGGTGVYSDLSVMYTTKPGGGAWTWTDIDNLMAGFMAPNIVNKQESYTAENWFTVYYRDEGGGGDISHVRRRKYSVED